jgi:hypothetical protein
MQNSAPVLSWSPICVELVEGLDQLPSGLVQLFLIVERQFQFLNFFNGPQHVPMPQEVLDALQQPLAIGPQLLLFITIADLFRQAFCMLPHDGQPHGDVEPVQNVLGLGVQVRLQVTDILAAV